MKNFRGLVSVFIIIIFTFSLNSCAIEPVELPETNNGGGTTTGYYVKVTKDGVVKQWKTLQGINTTPLNAFILTGADSTSSMSLVLFNVSDVGVYNLNFAEISCNYTEGTTIFSSNYSDFSNSAGNVTITELNKTNKTIKGTFNFIGKNDAMTSTKVFTKGEFFIKYTVQ